MFSRTESGLRDNIMVGYLRTGLFITAISSLDLCQKISCINITEFISNINTTLR